MKAILFLSVLSLLAVSSYAQDLKKVAKEVAAAKPKPQVEIMVLGSAHFGQSSFTSAPTGDLLSESRQREIADVNRQLLKFKPDLIMIETAPEDQASVDSLYALYKAGAVHLKDVPYGRSERYQFGHQLAKALGHPRIFGVDCYESVSNRILTHGDNIDGFLKGTNDFSELGREPQASFRERNLPLKDFLVFLNDPAVLDFTYRVMFVNPARVQNGRFTNPPAEYVDTAYVSKRYIGAEYISLFLERDLKVYSNIVTIQAREQAQRVLVIMGQRHAAILPKIFANDPLYKVVPLGKYLK
ncbi:DUF5694 domain-containing protein [Hymenobacter puniceus]|uniref:DUF5694 domain-containing protein n=1 Tax=Hymenobacter sp. BT190 TaxID=2763505 RepID=UPI001650D55E|nr:DUF5694 domain-containing protein [Hymenobacter sp. BT190]MBC6696734.1 hypothetical protein [Hymenobacter sp. BT190]